MLMKTLAILRVTFNNFRTLSLTSSACVNLHINLRLIISNARYRHLVNTIMLLNTLAILLCTQCTLGNFRTLSLTSSTCVNLHINLRLITSNALYRHLVNTMLLNTLAILLCTLGNFRTLSLTSSACVNLRINLLLLTSNARYPNLLNT